MPISAIDAADGAGPEQRGLAPAAPRAGAGEAERAPDRCAGPVRARLVDGRAPCRHQRRAGRCDDAVGQGQRATGRCATISAVRPSVSRRTASSTSASVSASRLAVGSSRTSSAAHRARRRGPGPAAGARPATGRRRRRPAGCRRPAGRRRTTASARPPPARPPPRHRWRRVARRGRCRPRSGRRGAAAGAPSRCRARQPSRSRSRRSTPPSRTWPELGAAQPEDDVEEGGLAAPARTGEGHHLPRLDDEVGAVQGRDAAAGVVDLEPGDADARVLRPDRAPPTPSRTGRLEQLEDLLGRLHPVGAGVEVGAEGAAGAGRPRAPGRVRRERRGSSCGASSSRRPTATATRATENGGQQLEDERREERQPEGGQRGGPVAVGDLCDRPRPGPWPGRRP